MCLSVMRFCLFGEHSHLYVLIFVHFFIFNGVANVVPAKLRWSIFVSKNCHKLVVSTSFWSWLPYMSWVFTSLKYAATFFRAGNACKQVAILGIP